LVRPQQAPTSHRMPVRALQSYRHEAFLWHDRADFTGLLGAFVEEGVEAGEPVMVALTPQHTAWLREDLSKPVADRVKFLDMAELGRNPARIIPAWREFVHAHQNPSRPTRGIGEPIWPSRRPDELLECQLHEALLNVAIEPDTPLWLICPYSAEALSPAVLEEAHRSHPVIVEDGSHRGSAHYAGRGHVDTLFGAPLPPPRSLPRTVRCTREMVRRLPAYLKLELHVAGLSTDRAAIVAAAAHQLALNSVHRGATTTTVRVWKEPDAIICEVADDVPVADPLVGRSLPGDDHEALWQANQVCDLVQLRSTPTSTTVRILSWN